MKEYVIRITTTTTVCVEVSSLDEAIEAAGNLYWQMDPDSADYEVVSIKER